MIIFSPVGIHQSRKPMWIQCSPLVSPEHHQPRYSQNTAMPQWQAWAQQGSCLRRAARNGGTSVDSKCLSGTEVLLSLTFPKFTPVNQQPWQEIALCRFMESQLVAGLFGAAGQGQKCAEVTASAIDCNIPSGNDGCPEKTHVCHLF